jgi:hypothetical protein
MHPDIDNIKADFRDTAGRIFQSTFSLFVKSVAKLDRRRDENVFQQLQGRYADELENRLSETARAVIERNGEKADSNVLRKELADEISYFVSEFLVKARSR